MKDIDKLTQLLISLSNFNLIKYHGHYVLTVDRGIGKPIIAQGKSLAELPALYEQAKFKQRQDGIQWNVLTTKKIGRALTFEEYVQALKIKLSEDDTQRT